MKEMRSDFDGVRIVESGEADVFVAMQLAAFAELDQDALGVPEIEHRQAPHLPIGVPGMRIVGVFEVHRPAVVQAILHLRENLIVGQIGQE